MGRYRDKLTLGGMRIIAEHGGGLEEARCPRCNIRQFGAEGQSVTCDSPECIEKRRAR